jgi:hypothetical protein
MPSHHGVGLDEDERRAPVPPRLGQYDPKQPIPPPKLRTGARAFQRAELLAEREVLEDQFMMSAAGQRYGADKYNDHLQHAPILSFLQGGKQPSPSGSDCGEGQIESTGTNVIVRLVGIVLLAGFGGCVDPCGNEVISEVPSPDRRLKAIVFERDCGATTDFSTQVSVMPSGQQFLTRATWLRSTASGNVFVADTNHGEAPPGPRGGPDVQVRWLGPTRLSISHDRRARVSLQLGSLNEVTIEVLWE